MDRLTENGIRIVRCLQSLLLAVPVRTGISTYIKRFPKRPVGYEALLKSYMYSRLSALYGEDKVFVEYYNENKKTGKKRGGRHDVFIDCGTEEIAIELKAYKDVLGFEDQYRQDIGGLRDFLEKGACGKGALREAFFLHYNHSAECDQTDNLLGFWKRVDKGNFGWRMMVVTGRHANLIEGENGIDEAGRGCPNFFLAHAQKRVVI